MSYVSDSRVNLSMNRRDLIKKIKIKVDCIVRKCLFSFKGDNRLNLNIPKCAVQKQSLAFTLTSLQPVNFRLITTPSSLPNGHDFSNMEPSLSTQFLTKIKENR